METVTPFLFIAGILLTSLSESIASQCSTLEPNDMKFSLSSYKNQTGHWVAQVKLEHGDNPTMPGTGQQEKGIWHVDIEQTTTQCSGSQVVQIVTTITSPASNVAPGYEFFPGVGYYKFHKTGQTWDQARKTCEAEGGYLAVINSEDESKIIQQYLTQTPKLDNTDHNDFVFIGFHDRFIEGEYITVFGTSLASTGFTRWAGAGQPDNAGGNENCGSVHRNGGLNDIPCLWKLAFFCEHELH